MPANPNFSQEGTLDFFNFMKEYYSNQSTDKAIQTVNRRLSGVETDVSHISTDTADIKKDIKLIKDSLDSGLGSIGSAIAGAGAAAGAGLAAKGMAGGRTVSPTAATRAPQPSPIPPATGSAAREPPISRPASTGGASTSAGAQPARPAPTSSATQPRPAPSRGGGGVAGAAIAATATAASLAAPFLKDMMGSQTQYSMPEVKGAKVSQEYGQALINASKKTGVAVEVLAAMGEAESGSGASMKNPVGTATGAFQFIDRTWANMLQMYGKDIGVDVPPPSADPKKQEEQLREIINNKQLMDLRYNHDASAMMAARYTQFNAKILKLDPSDPANVGKIYLGHFLGAGGAGQVLQGRDASPDQMRAVIASNKEIFKDSKGQPLIDFNNPDPETYRKIVTRFTENKMGSMQQRPNVQAVLGMSKNPSPNAGFNISLDTDSILEGMGGGRLDPEKPVPTFDRGSTQRMVNVQSSLGSDGTGRREPQMPKTGASVTSIGPTEQRLDPNRQNLMGQRLNEPRFEVPYEEGRKQSAQVFNYDEFKAKREERLRAQTPVSSLAVEDNKTAQKLTANREDRAPVSAQDDLKRSAVVKALGLIGKANIAMLAAEGFSEVADMYVDRSTPASVEQNMRQMGTQIPGPEGGVHFDYTPDQMQEYAARRTRMLTDAAVSQSREQGQAPTQIANRALEETAEMNQGNVIMMQPIVMPEKVIERNTPVPAQGSDPGVPPVSPPPSSVDMFGFTNYGIGA